MPINDSCSMATRRHWTARWLRHDVLLLIALTSLLHVALRWSVMSAPPYWDAVMGPFVQGIWLAENHLDYGLLLTQQSSFSYGGVAIYPWSIVPPIIGMLYGLLHSHTAVFLVMHLVNILLSGVYAGTVYWFLNRHLHYCRTTALLVALALLLTPVLGAQVDAVSMELPVAAVSAMAAVAFLARRWWTALALTLLAMVIKESSMLIVLAQGLVGGFLFCFAPLGRRERLALAAACGIPPLVYIGVHAFLAQFPNLETVAQHTGWMANMEFTGYTFRYCFPEHFILAGLAMVTTLVLGGWLGLREWRRAGKKLAPVLRRLAEAPRGLAHLYCLIIVAAYANFQFNYEYYLPRYLTWYLVFFLLLYLLTLSHLRLPRRGIMLFLALYAVWGGMNQLGAFRPPLPRHLADSGEFLERSREYIADLRVQQEMAAYLEAEAGDRHIVCDMPVDRMLTIPRMGYVSRPLNVYTTSMPDITFAPIGWFRDLSPEDYRNAIFIYRPTTLQYLNPHAYAPNMVPHVLWQHQDGNAITVIFELKQQPVKPDSR